MSKLNFSNISDAYNIPSSIIKETSDEITRLKKVVEDSTFNKKQAPQGGYERIGNPDKVNATFCPSKNESPQIDDFEYTFLKLSRSPQFEDVIKNYILFKHPDWLLSNTNYSHSQKESFGKSKTGLCDDIKNYIIFFIISMVIYLFLSLLLKKKN